MKFYQRLIVLLLIAVALLPLGANAAQSNAITVQHVRDGLPITGARFQLYQVSSGNKTAHDAYAEVLRSQKTPLATGQTNSQGNLRFQGLADGTYLLTGTPFQMQEELCEPEMILVTLPAKDVNGKPANIVILRPKFEIRDAQKEMQYTVIVLWEEVPGAKNKVHPETAEVFLYRNGSVAQSMVLGTAENWQYTWTETDPSAIWAALETVPQGYTVRYERQGNTLIIINTPIVKQHQNTTEDKLPQTGQLWWPVPILAMSGFVLLLLGWLRRKESRNET